MASSQWPVPSYSLNESLDFSDGPVGFRPPIPIELPRVANLLNHAEIEVGHHQFILVPAGHRDELAPRVAKVTLSVEFSDLPGFFDTHAIDRADEIAVGDGVRGLFELPQVFGKSGDGG